MSETRETTERSEAEDAVSRAPAAPASAAAPASTVATLQRRIGNRAVGRLLRDGSAGAPRLLARAPPTFSNVEVKKRFDVPIRSYSQDQVRALYLGQGITYTGEAVWDSGSASWIVDRANVVSMAAPGGSGGANGGGPGLPTKEDTDRFETILDSIIRSEPLPEEGTVSSVDDYSTQHMNAVKAVINFYMYKAYYECLDADGVPTKRGIEIVKRAGSLLTAFRGSASERSQSLIFRDAQRYFYGRVAAWSNADAMKAKSFTGISPKLASDPLLLSEEERKKGDEPMFLDDPDTSNIQKMKEMQSGYEGLKQVTKLFGSDISATQYPTSAPGGTYWLVKGSDDSYNDMKLKKYNEKTLPYLVR